jgi:hypothetical protein
MKIAANRKCRYRITVSDDRDRFAAPMRETNIGIYRHRNAINVNLTLVCASIFWGERINWYSPKMAIIPIGMLNNVFVEHKNTVDRTRKQGKTTTIHTINTAKIFFINVM